MNPSAGLGGRYSWHWALVGSLALHGLVMMFLGERWRPSVTPETPPLSVSFEWAAPVSVAGSSLSPHPRHASPPRSRSSPLSSRQERQRAEPLAVAPGQPDDSVDRSQDSTTHSVVLRSFGLARQMVSDPWAGRRITTLNASTQDSEGLSYETMFSHKVAEVGAVNYPPPQNGHPLSGTVRVATVLNADGTVAAVEVLRSSGEPLLDQSALHIVRMAAPFLPFTDSMRARMDMIRIVRTFNFVRAGEPLGSR